MKVKIEKGIRIWIYRLLLTSPRKFDNLRGKKTFTLLNSNLPPVNHRLGTALRSGVYFEFTELHKTLMK